jgi:hypothetical protein
MQKIPMTLKALAETVLHMYILVDFFNIQREMNTGENWPVTEQGIRVEFQ